jgi:hypothetical protein
MVGHWQLPHGGDKGLSGVRIMTHNFELVICELAELGWVKSRLVMNGLEQKDEKNPGAICDWQSHNHSSANHAMKIAVSLFLLVPFVTFARESPQFLDPLPKAHRAAVESISRQTFLSATNVQRTIVMPSLRWQTSGGGPGPLIASFKKAFESTGAVAEPTKEQDKELARIPFRRSLSSQPDASISIRWSDVYFLTQDGGFLSFGEIDGGFLFFTDKTAGVVLTKRAEPSGAANRSQPVLAGTNQAPAAAGSGR